VPSDESSVKSSGRSSSLYSWWLAWHYCANGERIIPQGEGKVEMEVGVFEAFPLPNYAAAAVSDDYKSYFIEVEPGIKIHVLEIGQGYPVYLQHGNPTTGLAVSKGRAIASLGSC
jgi:haloalkane dehalogenase